MSVGRYRVSPVADIELDELALYYSTAANSELGARFLAAAHDTFALLAAQPHIGWRPRFRRTPLRELRIFRINHFGQILILYIPTDTGIEILRVIHGSRNIASLLRHNPSP